MKIKALTLWQPWATLVAIGAKQIETRSWATAYRGPLAIHAAKHTPKEAADVAFALPVTEALRAHDYHPGRLPSGVVMAVCELTACSKVISRLDRPPLPELYFVTTRLGVSCGS